MNRKPAPYPVNCHADCSTVSMGFLNCCDWPVSFIPAFHGGELLYYLTQSSSLNKEATFFGLYTNDRIDVVVCSPPMYTFLAQAKGMFRSQGASSM